MRGEWSNEEGKQQISTPLAGGMAMAFVEELFLSLTATRPSFRSLFLASLVGFVTLPFRGVGVGFEEPHRRLVIRIIPGLGNRPIVYPCSSVGKTFTFEVVQVTSSNLTSNVSFIETLARA